MKQIIRQIKAIHHAPAPNLSHSMRLRDRVLITSSAIGWTSLPIAPGASLTTDTELTEHGLRYNHTLAALLACTHMADTLTTELLALRITLTDGTALLMGNHQAPHPLITLTEELSGQPADPSATRFTATLTTAQPLPEMIE